VKGSENLTSTRHSGASGFDLDTVDRLLTTTRAVRKRLDLERPVPLDVVVECLRLALQAPTGNNWQTWRWLILTDPAVKKAIGDLYRDAPERSAPLPTASAPSDADRQAKLLGSAEYLLDHMREVPVLVVPCIENAGGAAGWPPSIYPAVWSFILALRSRGLGSVITTNHLYRREEADRLLGIPDGFVQACLLPVAYFTGIDFKAAERRPVEEVAFLDRWGTPLLW
jgi:nitroreductase